MTELAANSRYLAQLFVSLDQRRVRYCVLRGYEALPETIGNDVDLLVAPADRPTIFALLRELAETSAATLIRSVDRVTFHALYLLWPRADAVSLHIDVWTELTWRGVPYVDAEHILAHAVQYRGISVADSGSEAAISLLKELLPEGRVKRHDEMRTRRRIIELAQRDAAAMERALARTLAPELARTLVSHSQRGEFERVEALRGAIVNSWLGRAARRLSGRLVGRWLSFALRRTNDAIHPHQSLFVSLIGPDGVGKSSVALALRDRLRHLFGKTIYIHSRPRILPPASEAISRLRGILRGRTRPTGRRVDETPTPGSRDGAADHHGIRPIERGRIVASLLFGYYSTDYLLFWPRYAREMRATTLILSDRYFDDYLVNGERVFGIPGWAGALVESAVPPPNLTIFLRASPEVVVARKAELTVTEVQRQNELFQRLAERRGRAAIVNAELPLEEVVTACVERIAAELGSRASWPMQ